MLSRHSLRRFTGGLEQKVQQIDTAWDPEAVATYQQAMRERIGAKLLGEAVEIPPTPARPACLGPRPTEATRDYRKLIRKRLNRLRETA